jgi:translation initiation factor 3 subunit H
MEFEESKRIQTIKEVVIDGLAALKIVKHCNDNFPTLVAGSLLGLDINETLEVTYTYPFPTPQSKSDLEGDALVDDMEGGEYQFEMMKMLQKVNIDNNCVGWYTSAYFGSLYNMETVNSQYTYQSAEELTENCVVIMFDPIQTRKGLLIMKAFRLSEKFMEMRKMKLNNFIKPSEILVEIPLIIKNSGHITAFLHCLSESNKEIIDCEYDILSMVGAEAYAEKSLELMGVMIDELFQEQYKFQQHSRIQSKPRYDYVKMYNKRLIENEDRRENDERELSMNLREFNLKPLPEAPPRGEALVSMGQLSIYCQQMTSQTSANLNKLVLTSHLNANASQSS